MNVQPVVDLGKKKQTRCLYEISEVTYPTAGDKYHFVISWGISVFQSTQKESHRFTQRSNVPIISAMTVPEFRLFVCNATLLVSSFSWTTVSHCLGGGAIFRPSDRATFKRFPKISDRTRWSKRCRIVNKSGVFGKAGIEEPGCMFFGNSKGNKPRINRM